MAQAGKDLVRDDRRTNPGITREPATSLRGSGSRRPQGAEVGAGHRQAQASSGCQCAPPPPAGPKVTGCPRSGGCQESERGLAPCVRDMSLEQALYLKTLTEDAPLFFVLIFYTPHSSEGLSGASLKIVLQFNKEFPLEAQTSVLIPGLMFFLKSLCILKNTKLCFSPVPDIYCLTLGKTFLGL